MNAESHKHDFADFLKHEWHLLVAFVIGLGFLGWEAVHGFKPHELVSRPSAETGTSELESLHESIAALAENDSALGQTIHGALSILMAMLVALTADLLWKAWKGVAAHHSLDEVQSEIATLSKRIGSSASTHSPPGCIDEYHDLFGNFEDVYLAYNPAYRIEDSPGMGPPLQLFEHRYKNERFKEACYLFLTAEGEESLGKFTAIMKGLSAGGRKKIRVRKDASKHAKNEPEVYIGKRKQQLVAIVGLTHFPNEHGRPICYLEIHDPDVVRQLKEDFEKAWNAQTTLEFAWAGETARPTA